MTDRELLESMSQQIGELVRHVAEVRSSNVKFDAQFKEMRSDMDSMRGDMKAMRGDIDSIRGDIDSIRGDIDSIRGDIRALDKKIDDKIDFVAGKIDHFVAVFHEESARDRTRFEEDRYARNFQQRKIEQRLDGVEARLDRLEAASSS